MARLGYTLMTEQAGPEDLVRYAVGAGETGLGFAVSAVVETVSAYWEAGSTDVALVHTGGDSQEAFLAEAAPELLRRLREAAPD